MHIPKETSDQSNASEGVAVKTSSQDVPLEMRKRPYDLADLVSRITDNNLHHEQDSGAPLGSEYR